jgi:integrase
MSTRFQTGYVYLRGKTWHGRYRRDVPGSTKRKQPDVELGDKPMTKTQARVKLADIIHAEGINKPDFLEKLNAPPVPVLHFNTVADLWVLKRLPQLDESTQYIAPFQINKHLRPFFGTMPLETIKTGVINDWIAGLTKNGSHPKSVHNLWKQFRAIMNWYAQQNDEPKRPWRPTLPVIPKVEQRWFTLEEAILIVSLATGQYKVLFHLAFFSGIRSGELSGLHVEDVDLLRGVVHVRRSVFRGRDKKTKTENSVRNVFIDSLTVQMLKEHLGGRTAGRVFQTRNGTPLENHNIVRQVLKPICKRLGVPDGGMHAWRHGRVSELQMKRVHPDFILDQVGHSSLQTTSIYTHFSPKFIHDTVEGLTAAGSGCAQISQLCATETASK